MELALALFSCFEMTVTDFGVSPMLHICSVTEWNPHHFSYCLWCVCVSAPRTQFLIETHLVVFLFSRTTMMKFVKSNSGSCLT